MRKNIVILCSISFIFLSIFLVLMVLVKGGVGFEFSYLLAAPENSGREGGIFPVLIGTLILWFCSMFISGLVGTFSAISMYELSFKSTTLSSVLLSTVYLLAGIPSIVFGLLGNELFVVRLGFGYSLLSGIGTISLMMIPLVSLSVYLGLRSMDVAVYRAASSLMLSKFTSYKKIFFPYLRSSILAGLLLASGRILAETAALLFTAGYSDRMPTSIMDSSRSLTVHIYDLMANISGGELMAYQSTFVLFVLIVLLNFALKLVIFRKEGPV